MHYFRQTKILVTVLLLSFYTLVNAQTYETVAGAYTELQPQFFDNGTTIDVYFNLEAWDQATTPWANNYDHIGQLNLSWNGVVFYRVEHGGLYSNSLSAIDYTINNSVTNTRYEVSTAYNVYTLKTIENDITITYLNTVARSGTYDVTQVHISVPKSTLGNLQSTASLTSSIEIYAYYYLRSLSNNANTYAGTHQSQTFTVFGPEEDQSGTDEVNFSATINANEGFVSVKIRIEKLLGEHFYDHIECLSFGVDNLTKGGTTIFSKLGHTVLTCDHDPNLSLYNFSGNNGDTYQLSYLPETDLVIHPQEANGDQYITIRHYFDPSHFGDDLRYYVSGSYYVKDFNQNISVPVSWNYNTTTINPEVSSFSLPNITGLAVAASTAQCQIDLSWNAYTSFGNPTRNLVAIYRDGIYIASLDPQVQTTFSDVNIQAGINYTYQVAALYGRTYGGGLRGNLTGGIAAIIPTPNAPFGVALTQGACAADITVGWGWTGLDPQQFVLERKTSTTGFTTISTTIPGGGRSFIDNNGIVTGELYSYRVAAIDGPCSATGLYSDIVTLTGDTIDVSLALNQVDLQTSKGYFADRTELFWATSGTNDQYLDRFKIYAREVGSTVLPTLLQTVNVADRSWQHLTGDAGVTYEYFIIGERVVNTACGTLITSTFEIASLDGQLTNGNLPTNGKGVAYAIGFRYPTGIINGNITYTGGIAVPNVKVVAEKYSGNNGNSLYLDGTDYISVPHDNSLMTDTAFTVSMWVKPQSLGSSVMFQKNGSFGIEFDAISNRPFMFVRDVNGTAYTLAGVTNSMQIGNWVNLTMSYSSATGKLKLYVNGERSGGVNILPVGLRILNPSTSPVYIGCQTGNSYFYQGYINEVKMFNRALTEEEVRRASGAVSATDANGLVAYWKMFVGVGNQVYDAAHIGSSYYKNDGEIVGADWTTDIPSTTQLGFAGYTDVNGNYSIAGVGYGGIGENFNIIPTNTLSGAVHEFDPSARTLFIGEGNAIHNGIDFTDISSFSFSGNVKFLFDNVVGVNLKSSGSEGVRMYLDGTNILLNSSNRPIETDANGFFNIDVPIGEHFIVFKKQNHAFVNEGRYPITGTWDFQDNLTGIEIWDTTTLVLTGKVVGGTFEANKPIGLNQTINNIGVAKFTVTSEDGIIIREILTDSITGEYLIKLPPKKYTYSAVKWNSNSVDIVSSGNISPIQLADVIVYNGIYETDSIFSVSGVFINIDSSFYHLRNDFIYREIPELVVSDTNSVTITGEQYYQFNRGDTVINIDMFSLPYPTYFSGKSYAYKMKAVEIYTNVDNSIRDTVAVTDGRLSINNNIGAGYYFNNSGKKVPYASTIGAVEEITLVNGELTYFFQTLDPNTIAVTSVGLEHTSFTKQMSVNLTVGSTNVQWQNPATPTEPFRAYIIGSKSIGNTFVTKAPTLVDFVLRDPPGSNSYAFWSSETTHTATQEYYIGGFVNASASLAAGAAVNANVGQFYLETLEASAQVTGGVTASAEVGGGGEFTQSTTFTQQIETNADPIQLGSADVFVAKSQNLESGIAQHIKPIPVSQCAGQCYGDTVFSLTGEAYLMGKVNQSFLNPKGTPTYFNFSESHIINVLLPDLEGIRNSLFLSPKYTSKLNPTDPNYGTNNDDPVWGNNVTSINYIRTEAVDFDGMSYTFDWLNVPEAVDSIRWVNQQIRLWRESLANNEIEKWIANTYSGQGENISMSSGNVLTRSKATSNSSYKYTSFEASASVSVGAVAHLSAGIAIDIEANLEVGVRTNGTFGGGKEYSLTTGFVLHDADEDDALSINVYPSEDKNGPIFSIVGGQTMCPHEDKIVMEFATVEYIQTLIDVQNGDANKARDEALAFGVIGASGNEAQKYGEASQIDASVQQLMALLAQLQAGEVILSNSTLQRDKPTMLINGSKTAQAFNVPANQPANFTLLLQNESESFDAQWYGIQIVDVTNPNGLQISIDGQIVDQQRQFFVPGGSAIQKILQVERGPFEYDYNDVKVIIHSTCQFDPTGNDALISDTVTFSVSFLPVCSDVNIISPDNNWIANNSFNNQFPITIGGYDVNSTGFEKIKVQYKPSSSASWILLETYFRDTTIAGWGGEPTLPQTGNTFTYNWQLGLLPDGAYDIRTVATCALAETNSVIHTGILDRLNPVTFGFPQPADGILSTGEEISIQFNETINAGLFSSSNIDIRGILNAGDIRHDASVYFSGTTNSYIISPQVNLVNTSFTLEMYVKRTLNGTNQVFVSQGVNAGTELSVGFNVSNQLTVSCGGQQITGTTVVDNNWHHIAFVYDENNANGELYFDGSLDGVNNSFVPQGMQKEDMYIGISKSGIASSFEGNVHELRIWNRPLSISEVNLSAVKRMMGNEAGLLHNWGMEEAKGTIAKDKVRGKHATMNATWVVEPIGYAIRLNGDTNQAILNPVSFTGAQDYTVEFWFKSDGGTNEVILSNGTGDNIDSNTSGWALGINAVGNFEALSNDEILASTNTVLDGQWHHAAIVSKAIGNTVLYVDALEEASITNDSLNGFAGPGLWLGQRGWFTGSIENNDKYFTGNVDEIRIWNTARTLDQIDRDRFNKLTGDEPSLREYYGFETYVTSQGVSSVASTLLNGANSVNSVTDTLLLGGTAMLTQITPTIKLKRPVSAIPFTYTINNDKVIIIPVIDGWKIENTQLDFTVSNVQDLNGNTLESPTTWAAYVNKNQVVWQDIQFDYVVDKGTSVNFQSNVINNSGQTYSYTISNIPSWLTVSPTTGSAGPLSATPISFAVPSTLNSGTYQQDILLTTSFGYDEKLTITVKVKEIPPVDWTVDPTAFQYSMNIVGQIAFNGVISRNEENRLGVFVNGICRGAAALNYVSAYDNYQTFLSIYSNQTSGEELEYRVWDASTGNVHVGITHTLPTTTFIANAFYGFSAVPELFDANNYVAGQIAVPAGWKWISFNLKGTDLDTINNLLSSLPASDNDIFKTRQNRKDVSGNYVQYPRFDTYTSANGWLGSLSQGGGADVVSSYKIKMNAAGTIHYNGIKADPTQDTIHLVIGWNYLGYLGQNSSLITEAMSNYTPANGDVLKSQYTAAVYDASYGWLGSLTQLDPNEGYMLYTNTNQSFTYPRATANRFAAPESIANVSLLQKSPWKVEKYKYPSNMTIIAHIVNDNSSYTKYNSNRGLLGAFVNGECRGVTYPIYNENEEQYIYVLTISGDYKEDVITFKLIDVENNYTYAALEKDVYAVDEIAGAITTPIELTLEKSKVKGEETPIENSIITGVNPNPFIDKTVISVFVTEETMVNIVLEDITGRVVRSISKGTFPVGNATFEMQKGNLPAGIYLLNVSANNIKYQEKVIIGK